MAATVWNPGWVQEHTQPLAMHAFRMVETQHIAATMRLVDTAAEQDLLEQMLDASKPPLPPEAQGIHYLLAAPFRYLRSRMGLDQELTVPVDELSVPSPFASSAAR